MKIQTKWTTGLLFLVGLQSLPVRAESSFSWHGFLSQGVSQSVDSDFVSDNEEVAFDLTELGINMRYDINASLAFVGQAVYLDGGNRYEQGGRLDYLYLDWRLPELNDGTINVNLGRFKNPHWLYSATRDVPQTRATIILPQSLYFDNFRDVALGSDGVLLRYYHATDEGSFRVNWSYGKSPMSDFQIKALLGEYAQGELTQKFAHQFSTYWQSPSLSWQLGASYLDSDFTYTPATVDFYLAAGREVQLYTVSLAYYAENWEFATELQRNKRIDWGGYAPDYMVNQQGEGGYAQLRYRITPEFTLTTSYDMYISDRDDRDGEILEAMTGGMVPAYYGFEKTVAVGLQWDPKPQWRIQAEHHWVHGAGRLTSLPSSQNTPGTREYWRMWAVQVMYWF